MSRSSLRALDGEEQCLSARGALSWSRTQSLLNAPVVVTAEGSTPTPTVILRCLVLCFRVWLLAFVQILRKRAFQLMPGQTTGVMVATCTLQTLQTHNGVIIWNRVSSVVLAVGVSRPNQRVSVGHTLPPTMFTMHSVEFRNCSGALTAGGVHLEHNVSATISNSAFLDCSSTHGVAMMLNGDVSLLLLNVSIHRNQAKGSGGALGAAKEGSTISIHGGTVVNNSAGED